MTRQNEIGHCAEHNLATCAACNDIADKMLEQFGLKGKPDYPLFTVPRGSPFTCDAIALPVVRCDRMPLWFVSVLKAFALEVYRNTGLRSDFEHSRHIEFVLPEELAFRVNATDGMLVMTEAGYVKLKILATTR